jgi:LemA protein
MMRSGKAWILVVSAIAGLLVLAGLVFFTWYIPNYNRAQRMDQGVQEAWSNVDTQLQRRLELVPSLVNTVKGYATHEKELFENIANSRTKYFQGGASRADKMDASNQLSGFLSRLLVLQERYPDLKANQNFLELQAQLEGTENRIAVARTRYNETVKVLNTYARSYFGRYICAKAGVKEADYFEATERAQTEVPEVNF